MNSFADDLKQVRFERLAKLLSNVDAAVAALPEEERRRYEESRRSIVDAAIWLRPKREW
jgi:hypothetical protein